MASLMVPASELRCSSGVAALWRDPCWVYQPKLQVSTVGDARRGGSQHQLLLAGVFTSIGPVSCLKQQAGPQHRMLTLLAAQGLTAI